MPKDVDSVRPDPAAENGSASDEPRRLHLTLRGWVLGTALLLMGMTLLLCAMLAVDLYSNFRDRFEQRLTLASNGRALALAEELRLLGRGLQAAQLAGRSADAVAQAAASVLGLRAAVLAADGRAIALAAPDGTLSHPASAADPALAQLLLDAAARDWTLSDLLETDVFGRAVLLLVRQPDGSGIALALDLAAIAHGLHERRVSPSSFTGVVDSNHRHIARSENHERALGTASPSWFVDAVQQGGRRLVHGRTQFGAAVVAGWAPVPGTGWLLATAEMQSTFEAGLRGALLRLALGMLLLLAAAIAIITFVARRLRRTSAAMARVVRGEDVPLSATADVTEFGELHRALLQADAEARRQRELREALMQNAPDLMSIKDRQGRYLMVNAAVEAAFGKPAAEMMGRRFSDVLPPDSARELEAADAAVMASGVVHSGTEAVPMPAGIRHYSTTRVPWRSLDGEIIGVIKISRDITALHKASARLAEAQDTLQQSNRLSAAAALAGGLAHELNQPLAALGNYLAAALRLLQAGRDPAAAQEAVGRALAQSRRAGAIVQGLRSFVGSASPQREAVPVLPLLRESLELAQLDAAGHGPQLVLRPPPASLQVLADRVQVQQVLVNLIRNAQEAMEGQAEQVLTIGAAAEGEMVVFSVRDTGRGLPPDHTDKLFRPLRSDKQRGLGLGLSICQTILEAHGGSIEAVPGPGGMGAEFRFRLPRVAARSAPRLARGNARGAASAA